MRVGVERGREDGSFNPLMPRLAKRSRQVFTHLGEMYGPQVSAEGQGDILEFIHESSDRVDGYVVNPAGLTTTSDMVPFALYDTGKPVIEVHFANIKASAPTARGPVYGPRESSFTPFVAGQFMGMREYSYAGALLSLVLALDDETFFGAPSEK